MADGIGKIECMAERSSHDAVHSGTASWRKSGFRTLYYLPGALVAG
jgi:hypothetical protein